LDVVLDVLENHGLAESTRLSPPHHPGRRDLSLYGLAGLPQQDADQILAEIGSLAEIGTISAGGGDRVSIRFSPEWVEEIGEALEAGEGDALSTDGICADKQLVVDFCDPNANKALHVGHLRNLALGQSVAQIARACGATVLTTSQVGDVGRSMAEALAGYLLYADGKDPAEIGEKSDHFIGGHYSRYVHDQAEPSMSSGEQVVDPALSREDFEHEDHATRILVQLRQTDPEILELWGRARAWALEGHEETFGRLQVAIDRKYLESEFLPEIESIGDQLVEAGAVAIAPNGVAFYETGDSNYPHLVLRSSDGSSTQHLRYIALWHATRSSIGSRESLQVMGDEWLHIGEYGDVLLGMLSAGEVTHPMEKLLHGMVSAESSVVKSSGEAPWLIDDLLDELVGSPEIAAAAGGEAEVANRLAAIAALGFFLGHPPSKGVSLSREALLDPSTNAGWALALASLKAWDERYDGAPDPLPADRAYRFLVAQSQVHKQLARRSCDEFNPAHLARLHLHLARWFLETPCEPSVARMMRTVSAVGLSTLGLGSLVPVAA
jgi:arginyl-tRNA synthetase